MTHSNPDNHSNPHANNRRLLVLRRGGMALGGLLTIGVVGGTWSLWTFIHKDLVPLAETSLSTSLNRPVKLGKVKGFSLSGVQFGASSIPATPTDPEKATVDAVDVTFDPLQLLFNRTLKLDVTLVNPDIYAEQNQQGRWITTTLATPGKQGPIQTQLDKIHFRNAKLVIVPRQQVGGENSPSSPPTPLGYPVTFTQLNGSAQLLDNYQQIKFEVSGLPSNGGSVSLKGDARPKTFDANLQVQAKDFLASDVTHIIKLPGNLQAGRVQGDLNVQLKSWNGSQQSWSEILIDGSAVAQGVQLQVPRVPQTFNNSQGNLRFQGTKIQLENITSSYGKIPLVANGTLDTKAGFKLAATVKAVSLASALETLKLTSPVPVTGEVKADLQVVGPNTAPILLGTVTSTKPAKVDQVDFSSFRSKFDFDTVAAVINLKDIQAKPKVGGDVTGTGSVKLTTIPQLDFNLKAKNVPGDAIAGAYNIKTPFQINTVAATARLTGSPSNTQTLVRLQAPSATYPANGEGTIITQNQAFLFRNIALNVAGGTVQASGSLVNQRWQGVADASQIQVDRFIKPSQQQNISLQDARFNGRFILSGTNSPFKVATIRPENARLLVAGGTVAVSKILFGEQSFTAELVADGIRPGRLLKQATPPALTGPLAGTFQIAGNTNDLNLNTLRATGKASLGVGGGTVTASNIQLANGRYQAQVQANDLSVQQLAAQLPPQVQGKLNGQFNVAGSVESVQPQTIQATGQARLNVAGGTVNATNIQLANGRYQAQVQANNVQLQRLAKVPPQAQGSLTGQFNVAGSATSFQPQTIQATGQARLNNIAGGTVTANNIQLADGRYQAVVDASGVQLNRFSPQLRGQFGSKKLQVAGNVETRNFASLIQNLRANGQVDFSQGLAGLEQPLTAVIGWDGEKLNIERATAQDLNASGYIAANFTGSTPEITDVNLNVQAQNYNLQKLPVQLPNAVAVAGEADFSGQIRGKLPVPNVQGQLKLRDLVVNNLAFEPLLSGPVQSVQGQGASVDLTGTRDRIAASLDAANRPNSFTVKWKDALASGQSQGDNLAVKVDNFPLAILKLTPPPSVRVGAGGIAGVLTANMSVNQKTFATAVGDVAIARPQIGRIKGDRVAAQFRYENGTAKITSSEFDKGNSRYALAGTFTQTSKGPRIQAKVNVTQGQIQDVLTVLQLYDLQDFNRGMAAPTYGKAVDLANTAPVGLPNQPLYTQLERFAEIEALLTKEQKQRRNASFIPDLADLSGTFNAAITVDTATANGLAANFNVNGQNFVWGKLDQPDRLYKAEQIIAQGSFENGVLRLLPLRLESQNRLIAFSGNIGSTEQSGQLRVTNFPIQMLNNFVKLPVDYTGNLNATATLAGSIKNPQAKGELQIIDGTLNQKPVQSATASFSYNDGRLNFGSNVLVASAEPVNITGSIPYQLPFAAVAPASNDINLDVNVKNEGLGLLNLLTDQVAFEKGEGEVDLTVSGTIQQPVVKGIANVNNATFTAQALPGKLTDVTGNVQFNLDQINVENFQGNFNKGKVEAQGNIPIFGNSQTQIANPLTVNLDKLAVNLKTLYKGGVSGNLQITGSARHPAIGGQLQLANGQVLLPKSTDANNLVGSNLNMSRAIKQNKQNDRNKPETGNPTPQLKNLQLTLGKNVAIASPPIISFQATGTLDVNGPLTTPVPEGTITLKGGGVNLFATQFKLARGYEQTATFRANQPRDPDLNVYLVTNVVDSGTTQVTNSPTSSEINDQGINTSFEAVKTIRVDAKVNGPASEINENLELTSSPSRSKTEIVALLGGSFVQTLGRGSTGGGESTVGLANLAGSALNIQQTFSQIGNALGFSEFRIYPTFNPSTANSKKNTSPSNSQTGSGIDVAVEAGVDITRNFYASILKVLTTDQAPQLGINYRINPDLRVRTSTDFSEDTNAIIEYQTRF